MYDGDDECRYAPNASAFLHNTHIYNICTCGSRGSVCGCSRASVSACVRARMCAHACACVCVHAANNFITAPCRTRNDGAAARADRNVNAWSLRAWCHISVARRIVCDSLFGRPRDQEYLWLECSVWARAYGIDCTGDAKRVSASEFIWPGRLRPA